MSELYDAALEIKEALRKLEDIDRTLTTFSLLFPSLSERSIFCLVCYHAMISSPAGKWKSLPRLAATAIRAADILHFAIEQEDNPSASAVRDWRIFKANEKGGESCA
jgi:hypothetical protein